MNDTPMASAETLGTTQPARAESIRSTWATCVACLICIGIFIGISSSENLPNSEPLARFGYLTANGVWNGQYWALITSAFVHVEILHVALNVYWLWVLGSRLERTIGATLFLVLYIVSAFVSSAFQLAVSDSTGIGASGVVYSMFGFMWLTRSRYPLFAEALPRSTIWLFVVWLFFCLATTYANVWIVGNGAHFSGIIFGSSLAVVFVIRRYRPVALAVLGFMLAASITICVWCPWSTAWLCHHAYRDHVAGRYQDAINQYSQILKREPLNAWALNNRASAYQSLGDEERAREDLKSSEAINSEK